MSFTGAKAAILIGDRLLVTLRDDRPDIPYPAMWDLPGGGREGCETPEACVLRELQEEFGLEFGPERLLWRKVWPSMMDATRDSVFFAGRITAAEVAEVRFGDEGQYWRMMPVAEFLTEPLIIPEMQRRVRVALGELGWG